MSKLLKYRVNLADGTSLVIEATNAHNAASIARSKVGQLPNEINMKIKKDLINSINKELKMLVDLKEIILTSSNNLDWENVYGSINSYLTHFQEKDSNITKIKELNGSLVKINKENK